jgi:hypothetical protein
MPLPATAAAPPINVVINGWLSPAPVAVGTWEAAEKDKDIVAFLDVTPPPNPFTLDDVLGSGPLRSEEWRLSNLSGDTFPDGVILRENGSFRGAPKEREPGEFPKTFFFHVDLTLPGTMRLTYGSSGLVRNDGTTSVPFSLNVDIFSPIPGDFDGNRGLDLADLILLSRLIHGSDSEKADARAEMERLEGWRNSITRKTNPNQWPDGTDLTELSRWFAQDRARSNWVPPSN